MNAPRDDSHGISDNSIYSNTEYLENNPSWHVEDSAWKATKIHDILQRNNLAPEKIAEVGCGAGEILIQLKQLMPQTSFVGFEMSEQAFALAASRERAGIHYTRDNFFDTKEQFDALLCIDVFEHVDDYIGFIKSLRPHASYKIFHIPLDLNAQAVVRGSALLEARHRVGHLHYFSKETAIETIKYCGYDIIDFNLTALALDLPNRGLRTNLMNLPRRLLAAISEDMAARILGGWSLMVLAR